MGKIINRVSLKDVASAVGLDASTVSLALRDDPRLSEATKERVKQAAERLGYRPNPLVSAWLRQVRNPEVPSSGTGLAFFLGLSVSEQIAKETYYTTFVEGARAEATALGYDVMETIFGSDDGAKLLRVIQRLRYQGVRGVIVFDPGLQIPDVVMAELKRGFAVVVILRAKDSDGFHRVAVDIAANVALAMRNLRAAGCRRIALPIAPISASMDAVRKDVLAAYMLQQRLLPARERVPLPGKYIEHAGPMVLEWLKAQRADAFLGVNKLHHEFVAGARSGSAIVYAHLGVDALPHMTGVVNRGFEVGRAAVFKLAGMVTSNRFSQPEVPLLTLVPGVWQSVPKSPRPSRKSSPR